MNAEDDLLTINEAARRSGKSVMTIRKYLGLTGKPSKLPNASKVLREGQGQETWAIPLSDLYNSGLMKAKVTGKAESSPPKIWDEEFEDLEPDFPDGKPLTLELVELRAEVLYLRQRVLDLEAILEKETFRLDLLLTRSLETGKPSQTSSTEPEPARKKRFWER